MEGSYQSNIKNLPILGKDRYENIFKLHKTENNQWFYNLKKSITFPDDVSEDIIDTFVLDTIVPWTVISYNIYGTIFLWWTVTELNKIVNPVQLPENGKVYKYIKPSYIEQLIAQINLQKDV